MTMSNVSSLIMNNAPSSLVTKILWRQQRELVIKHPDGVTIVINEEDPLDIGALIEGPKDTPYQGGTFKVKIVVGSEFPAVAPKGYCLTKIFHPNVSEKGEICVNTLKRDWNPKQWSLYHVLEVIKCLLIVPFPESSLNEEAGKLFMEDYERYFKIASIYTNVHASSRVGSKDPNDKEKMKIEHNSLPENNTNDYFRDNNQFLTVNSPLETPGFRTPTGLANNTQSCDKEVLNYNILNRHCRSVCFKSSLKFGETNNKIGLNRKDSNVKMIDEVRTCQKPNISSLPFIMRSHSFVYSNTENENLSNINNNIQNHNGTIQIGGISSMNQTPRSKKDEIKKWLSRI